MARKFIDGFEHGKLDLWEVSGSSVVLQTGIGGFDGYCMYLQSIGTSLEYIKKTLDTAYTEIYLAFKHRPNSNSYSRRTLRVDKGANPQIYVLRSVVSERLSVITDYTTVATGTAILALNTTYEIEVYIKIHATLGRVVVKVDGITDIDYTGNTVNGSGDTTLDTIILGAAGEPSTGPRAGMSLNNYASGWFDDIVIDSTAYPGTTHIQAIQPNGVGSSTQWTALSGANWDNVDEIPPSDADYVYVNAVGQVDLYTASNLVGTIAAVKCVQVQARSVAQGAPTPTTLQLAVRTHATNYFGASIVVPTAFKGLPNVWENNPFSGVAWTVAEVNDVEIGVKSTA